MHYFPQSVMLLRETFQLLQKIWRYHPGSGSFARWIWTPRHEVLQFAFDSLDEGSYLHTATHLQSAYVTPELMITTRLAAGIRHCARNAATKYAATHTAAMIHISIGSYWNRTCKCCCICNLSSSGMFCVSVQKDA